MGDQYQLRHAAGLYWLVWTNQMGSEYQKPIPINEVGAFIWKQLSDGESEAAVVRSLSREYRIEQKQAGEDVAYFLKQLREHGVIK